MISPADVLAVANLIDKGGVVVVLLAVVAALTWVARWLLGQLLAAKNDAIKNAQEERNAWRTIALGITHTAEKSVTIAEQQVGLR